MREKLTSWLLFTVLAEGVVILTILLIVIAVRIVTGQTGN